MDALPNSSAPLREHGQQLLDRAHAVVQKIAPDVQVHEIFEIVDPSTLLIQLSSTAHLLVLGSRGRGPVRSHLLGSVGLAVVRHAACPVVVHRPGDHPGLVHRGVWSRPTPRRSRGPCWRSPSARPACGACR